MTRMGLPITDVETGSLVIRVPVQLTLPSGPHEEELWFRLPASTPPPTLPAISDSVFSVGLLLAMASDRELVLSSPVSPRLLDATDLLQDILSCWWPKELAHARIEASARSAEDSPPRARGTLALFSGGVDSFFTLVKNHAEIAALTYVSGFDIPLRHREIFELTRTRLEQVAELEGLPLIVLSTNMRTIFSRLELSWPRITHGAGLASIATLLSGSFDRLLIASGSSYAQLHPWGSHPMTDVLRSTEYLDIVHDGAERHRVEKVRAIVDLPSAQQHLRVCTAKEGVDNCGRCEKCLRTMVTLEVAGALDRFPAFPPLDLGTVRDSEIKGVHFALENLRYARDQGRRDVVAALRHPIGRYWARQARLNPRPPTRTQRLVRKLRRRLRRLGRKLVV